MKEKVRKNGDTGIKTTHSKIKRRETDIYIYMYKYMYRERNEIHSLCVYVRYHN